MADDELVVEIEQDKLETKETVVKTETADPVADLQAQLEEIKANSAAELSRTRAQAQRETAVERQARLAAEEKTRAAETEITETRLSTVESGLSAAQTEVAAAKAEYISAQEAGDWKRAADAQERLAEAKARAVRLDEAKADLEVAKALPQPRKADEPQQRTDTTVADPVETFISGPVDVQGNRRAPQAQDWLRKHTDYITDARKLKKLSAADMDAQAEGMEINSPEYFAHVEKFLGLTKDPVTNGKTPPTRRATTAAPVAPVNASTSGGVNGGGNEVRLSKNEAAAATDGTHVWNYDDPSPQKRFKKGDPIGVQEFARRKKAMTEEGRYDPMNFVQQ